MRLAGLFPNRKKNRTEKSVSQSKPLIIENICWMDIPTKCVSLRFDSVEINRFGEHIFFSLGGFWQQKTHSHQPKAIPFKKKMGSIRVDSLVMHKIN